MVRIKHSVSTSHLTAIFLKHTNIRMYIIRSNRSMGGGVMKRWGFMSEMNSDTGKKWSLFSKNRLNKFKPTVAAAVRSFSLYLFIYQLRKRSWYLLAECRCAQMSFASPFLHLHKKASLIHLHWLVLINIFFFKLKEEEMKKVRLW